MPQPTLGHPGARPAAREFQEMKQHLRCAPRLLARLALVTSIHRMRDQRQGADIGRQFPGLPAHLQPGISGQHQQRPQQEQPHQTHLGDFAHLHRILRARAALGVQPQLKRISSPAPWHMVEPGKITPMQKQPLVAKLQPAKALVGMPFNDSGGVFRLSRLGENHWKVATISPCIRPKGKPLHCCSPYSLHFSSSRVSTIPLVHSSQLSVMR